MNTIQSDSLNYFKLTEKDLTGLNTKTAVLDEILV